MGFMKKRIFSIILFRILFGLWFIYVVIWPVNGLRPLRQRTRSWGDELVVGKEEHELGPFSSWNITGTYRGNWMIVDSTNGSSKFPDFSKSSGKSTLELITTPTKITSVHYVKGVIVFHDGFENEHDATSARIRVDGVYIWPFRQLRMLANSGKEDEAMLEDDYFLLNPYHLLRLFSSHVFLESPEEKIWRQKHSPIYEMEKHCNIEIAAQISLISSSKNDGRNKFNLGGLVESASMDNDVECLSPMLLNATSVDIEVYYNKAVNYTLMATFISFLQILLLIRQMEYSNTQSGAAKISLVMIGHQAIMDAYICLLHLTAGILVESLFNAFATSVFFKFVVFSIFEMRYLLTIWKANRPANTRENWETMRRELSILYSRFYGVLLGGILAMFQFRKFLRFIIFLLHSFWIPQIITNVVRNSRKPLHPHYILGITVTRMAIPFYVFGCPHNFMRIEPDRNWCISLAFFMGFQAFVLLLQHYFGSLCFIPRQILSEKYCYYKRFDQGSNHTVDCVICMTAIDFSQRSNDCMVTPCDHFFHSGCLQRWMDVKMECPTCRRPLPPA